MERVVEAQPLVAAIPDGLLVGLGDPEKHSDGAHRHLRPEIGDEVEAAGAHERVQAAGAELPHLGLNGGHLAGCEHPRHEAAMHVVRRGVLEDERAGGHLACRS